MLHYVIRKKDEDEPIALMRINARERGNMHITTFRVGKFGPFAKIDRNGHHIYNLMFGEHDDVAGAMMDSKDYQLEEIEKSEWESWKEMDLFPVLKTAVAR